MKTTLILAIILFIIPNMSYGRYSQSEYHKYLIHVKYPRRPVPSGITRFPDSGFVFFGRKFHTIDEWKASPEYEQLQELHKLDASTEEFKKYVGDIMYKDNLEIMRKYNKCRTIYDLNRITKTRRDNAKKTMGWKTLPPVNGMK